MSTLAVGAAGALASAVEAAGGRTGPVQRLLAAREARARRLVLAQLAAMDDVRLEGLGFSDDDIVALRAGELRLPR